MAVADGRIVARRASGRSETPSMLKTASPFPDREGLWGPVTRSRLVRSMAVYACLYVLSAATITLSARPGLEAFALGLILPGGGFLAWAGPDTPIQILAIGLFFASFLMFLVAVVIWFATGNILAPIAVWLVAALAAGFAGWGGTPQTPWAAAQQIVPFGALSAMGFAFGAACYVGRRGLRRRADLNAHLRLAEARIGPASGPPNPAGDELSEDDLRLMRLLLDRALQPVEAFEGFEWVDQFQTAAMRYQLNFMSYALSVAQAVHLPACRGYFHTAQENLVAKQRNYRVWRYWKLENMWGNLRMGADPVARDNIMFSGFLAAQIAYFHGATGVRTFDEPGSLPFEHPSGERYAWSLPALINVLAGGYRGAEYGLLACEPNWIYPLCNAISASAIRAHDAANGTSCWDGIADSFRQALET